MSPVTVIISKVALFLLGRLVKRTDNTIDDEIVKIVKDCV